MKNLEDRINDLEIKFSYQDELINELNLIVAEQSTYIEQIKKSLQELKTEKQDENVPNSSLENERPPHY